MECSAKTGTNIDKIFETAIDFSMKKIVTFRSEEEESL